MKHNLRNLTSDELLSIDGGIRLPTLEDVKDAGRAFRGFLDGLFGNDDCGC